MSTDTTIPAPDVAPPVGAVTVDDWCDLGCSEGPWREVIGERRGIDLYYVGNSAVGPHYVEAHGIQEADGRVSEECVRAQIDAWNLNRYENWDTMLTPADARQNAVELRAVIAELSVLANAFDTAADEVDGWVK